jgi:hypothetical protein
MSQDTQEREEEQQSILTGQNRTAVSPLSCVTMPPSTGLPCTANLDRNILKHFLKVCQLKDDLIHPTNKKQKAANSTPQETDRLSSLPEEEIARHSQILGMYLGKRLHAKYCQVIASKLQGQDGYAILDLVPSNSPWCWKEEQKKHNWRL